MKTSKDLRQRAEKIPAFKWLSVGAWNALLYKIDDWPTPELTSQFSALELLALPGFGRGKLHEVREWLLAHGLCLRGESVGF